MIVRYSVHGGRRPPRDREILEIQNDASFTLWRSVGSATDPPTPVGRFSGKLDQPLFQVMQQEATNAARFGDLEVRIPPGSSIEQISLGDQAGAKMGVHAEPDGAWGVLVNRLRQLLGDLTDNPQAAIGVEVFAGGQRARLFHLGDHPLSLALQGIDIRAVLWQGEWDKIGDWWMPEEERPDLAKTQADVGWSFELPFGHGFEITENREVVAYVTFTVFDDEIPVQVSLESPRSFD